jgi:Ca-activated chloride channel family protein
VRTAVGELYLRLATRAASPEDKASLLAEGHRAFGEIVEFAPEDPVARRRLGDFALGSRLFADAARQYETLARLTPDDAKVLLAGQRRRGPGAARRSAEMGGKGRRQRRPRRQLRRRRHGAALAATHLAWARLAAADGKRAEELEALSARAARVLSGARSIPTSRWRAASA